jgi:hypothetical protein
MNTEQKILADALSQLLGVAESLEPFIDWSEAGEDLKKDLDMAIREARELFGTGDCEDGVCVRR